MYLHGWVLDVGELQLKLQLSLFIRLRVLHGTANCAPAPCGPSWGTRDSAPLIAVRSGTPRWRSSLVRWHGLAGEVGSA